MSSSLQARVITALILMAVLVFISTQFSAFSFALFVAFVVLLAAWEWAAFLGLRSFVERLPYIFTIGSMLVMLALFLGVTPGADSIDSSRVAILCALGFLFWSFTFLVLRGYPENAEAVGNRSRIAFIGMCAFLPTWAGMVYLKYLMPEAYLVLALIIMVAAVDVGAFFVGSFFGHTKLSSKISPNKSWEGVWGGLATCLLLGLLFTWLYHRLIFQLEAWQLLILSLLSICVSFYGVVGDLVESMLKRNCDVKDSGAILPGHGGLLDRVDSLMAVTPIFVLTIMFTIAGFGQS